MFSFKKREKKEQKKESVGSILLAVAAALLFRMVAFETYRIPSGSMLPNLLIGDLLFVSKYSYGYSKYSFAIPFTELWLPFSFRDSSGRVFYKSPEIGDVVVFRFPLDPSTNYIKRVVGRAGDRVQVTHGVLHINGEPVKLQQVEAEPYPTSLGSIKYVPTFKEKLPNGVEHIIWKEDMSNTSRMDNTPEYVVPENHFFMMGDNRDNSGDSRAQVGFVPSENIIGQAKIVAFSKEGDWYKVWTWPWTLRFKRFFTWIR